MYVLAPRNDMSYLNVDDINAYIQDLPEISQKTREIFIMVQKKNPKELVQTEFSKIKILQKITEYRESAEKASKLQNHQYRDLCSAMSRAVLNVSCLAGIILSGALISNLGSALEGGFGFSLGYVITGAVNQQLENPGREIAEAGIEVCDGFFCGPCFAVREAVYRVPERISQAQEQMRLSQDNIISDFNGLVTLGLYPANENPLRRDLMIEISRLRTKIDDFTKLTNQHLESPEKESSEDGLEVCNGFFCGSYFGGHEAVVRVPERIALTQSNIISDSDDLVTLSIGQKNENPLSEVLSIESSSSRIEIDDFTKSAEFLASDRFKTSQTTKDFLAVTASSIIQKEQLDLRVYEMALKELDVLMLYIQRRILPRVFQEAVEE